MALVVARAVLMGFTEVADGYRAIDGRHDLGKRDVLRFGSEDVAAADTAFGANDARPFEGQEDLLQVRLGESRALGDVTHRGGGRGAVVEGQREQRTTRIVTPGRDLHGPIVREAARTAPHGLLAVGDRLADVGELPVLPNYAGACIANVVPALLDPTVASAPWMPEPARDADQVVLLVLDGLGWEQLQERPALAPTLCAMAGGPITSVAPSTTATALTSITTGLPPGEHGLVGYRMALGTELLNVLRWHTKSGDARKRINPGELQPRPAFAGQCPVVVTKAEFARSGFSAAHLDPVRFRGYRVPSSIAVEVSALLRQGEPFAYAYYDGIDKVSHEYGLAEHYDAELLAADRLVAGLLEALPPRAALLVTADHGQVHTGEAKVPLHADVKALVARQSGEARFRWLHARPGRADELAEAARACHDDDAWVRTREEIEAQEWLGPKLSVQARERLGDVALIAKGTVAFDDPNDTGILKMLGRHGSVTSAEMMVPLLAQRG